MTKEEIKELEFEADYIMGDKIPHNKLSKIYQCKITTKGELEGLIFYGQVIAEYVKDTKVGELDNSKFKESYFFEANKSFSTALELFENYFLT